MIADAHVVLYGFGAGGMQQRLDSTTTNDQGRYSFDSHAIGTMQGVVTMAGYQTGQAFPIVSRADEVDVVANPSNTVDFRLLASGPATTCGSIIGTVTDAARKAVARARVVQSRAGTSGGAGPLDTVETDAFGDFAFDSVAALQNDIVTVTAADF